MIYAGIDEAGYGPMLGPLCIGLSVFRIDAPDIASEGQAPDLWKVLAPAVCREARDRRRRIAVNDSKALKLPNNAAKQHPLVHLERGCLAFCGVGEGAGVAVADDAALFARVGAMPGEAPWYAGSPTPLPLSGSADLVGIDVNRLRLAMDGAGTRLVDLRCRVLDEQGFNRVVQRSGTKAATTGAAVIAALRRIAEHPAVTETVRAGGTVRVACDRLGGRTRYTDLLTAADGEGVCALEESARACVYDLTLRGTPMRVLFRPEADGAHLTVALSSMLAKFVRELLMMRFNRYWSARDPMLKPTAGYTTDARRWLRDAERVATPEERRAMVRLA